MIDEKVKNVLDGVEGQIDAAVEALRSKKAENLVLIDVRGISFVTDFYLLASGRSMPQLKALASSAQRILKPMKGSPVRISGTPESGWMLIDAGDLVVHVFTEEMRDYYNLEELWNDAIIRVLQ